MPRTARPKWLSGKRLFFLNFILVMIPVTYFAYRPILSLCSGILIYSDEPIVADAIIVLTGGEPGRAWEAADLYRAKLAPRVALTTEFPTIDEVQLRQHGIELTTRQENYKRVLSGMGVPDDKIMWVIPEAQDTFNEIIRIREFAKKENWKSLILVTSNYHSRRTRLTADYVFPMDLQFAVVASRHGGINREDWFTRAGQVRTFLIEFEELVAYTLYIWPRRLLGLWTSRSDTKPSRTLSASVGLVSMPPS